VKTPAALVMILASNVYNRAVPVCSSTVPRTAPGSATSASSLTPTVVQIQLLEFNQQTLPFLPIESTNVPIPQVLPTSAPIDTDVDFVRSMDGHPCPLNGIRAEEIVSLMVLYSFCLETCAAVAALKLTRGAGLRIS
jgi:hypothetical protein